MTVVSASSTAIPPADTLHSRELLFSLYSAGQTFDGLTPRAQFLVSTGLQTERNDDAAVEEGDEHDNEMAAEKVDG